MMTQDTTGSVLDSLLNSDSDTDDSLDCHLAKLLPNFRRPNTKQRDSIRSKEEERNHPLAEGSLKHPTSIVMRASPTNSTSTSTSTTDAPPSSEGLSDISPDLGLKDPPSYPSHIQRKADEFVALERRQITSKKQGSSGQKPTSSAVDTKIKPAAKKPRRRCGERQRQRHGSRAAGQRKSCTDRRLRTAVVSQDVSESDADGTEPMDEESVVGESENKDEPADSDSSVCQESAASKTGTQDHDRSSMMKKEDAEGDVDVPLSLDFPPSMFDQLGKCRDDAIVLSSDSEVEDGEHKPGDSDAHAGKSEDAQSHGIGSGSNRPPRKCKVMRWTNTQKRNYKKDHPCIGTKGLPIKNRHRDRICESCDCCKTCTSPPWCSNLEKPHTYEEESGKGQTRTTATKDNNPNATTASPSENLVPRKRQIAANSPKKPGLSKRKRSVDGNTSRKKAKATQDIFICGKKMMGPSMRPAPLDIASTDDDRSAPGDGEKQRSKGLQRIPTKAKKKKKKRGKKRKSKGNTEQSGVEMKYIFQLLVDKMVKLEEKVDKQKRFEALFSPVSVKSEEPEAHPRTSINERSVQPTATNFLAREDLQRALEQALVKMAAQTPSALRRFPVGSDPKLAHGLQCKQNGPPAKPGFGQSAQEVKSSEDEQISQTSTQLHRPVLAMQGNQNGEDTANAVGGTDGSRQTPQVATQTRQQENCSVAATPAERPQTAYSPVTEEKSMKNRASEVVDSSKIRRLKQQRNDRREVFNAGFQRLRQQSNGDRDVVPKETNTSSETASPPQHFPNRERTKMLLLLIILATATTEPPILNGIVFVLVAFGIVKAESGIWHSS